ncbi:MAG TPA: BTAD domain-containing putative transcriptional regulator [Nocardioidaceae bacterium]|nr:BTAD domain-containing putative transcriptional regulator [Nocardioidaceae bacterium]
MRINVLGPLEITEAGEPIEIRGSRLRVLVIRLALDAGRYVSVESLVDALWEDEPPADQLNALQSLVSRLRRALPASGRLESGPAGYRLDVPADAVDAAHFDSLASDGRRALEEGDPASALSILREALALWRGPALADVTGAAFAEGAAHRLEQRRLSAIEDRLDAELATGPTTSAITELETIAAQYPLRERTHGLLVRALSADGRQADALRVYEALRGRLADELGADPSAELQQLHVAVLRGELDRGRVTAPAPSTNLTTPLSSLVGRDEELERLRTLVAESRLVTVVGPGGAGKTRLATTAASGLVDRMPGGAWMVELASVTDPGDMPLAILDALGRREASLLDNAQPASPRDATSRLTETLGGAATLLVLDNCEHLIDAAARLADYLLGHCPELRILATSREPLVVVGEMVSPVPPLAAPSGSATVAEALDFAAVRLFAERARSARPDFEVNAANVDRVVEICRRLDGLPLAIELAAARLRALPVEQIAARLDDRFRLLTSGSRTADARHQTLRAVVAWSWDLLTDKERDLAERLSVFPGGATPESVEGACQLDAGAALDLLAALVDKSLLQVVGDAEPRYRMLETLREYGQERLAEAGATAAARAAHAAYFLRLAETAEPQLRGSDQLRWIGVLTAERDNLVAALRFAVDASDADTAVHLGAAMGMHWLMQGSHAEGADWLQLALDVPGDVEAETRAVALTFFVINTASAGRIDRIPPVVDDLRTLAETVGSQAKHPILAVLEPGLAVFGNDHERGLAAIEQALPHPDPWAEAALYLMRAAIKENLGYAPGIRDDLIAATDAFRRAGERWGMAMALHLRGELEQLAGDLDAAIGSFQEALQLTTQIGAADDVGQLQLRLAVIDALRGRTDQARAELHRILDITQRQGRTHIVVYCLISLGHVARYAGDLDEAAHCYEAAREALTQRSLGIRQLDALLLTGSSYVRVDRGDLAHAERDLVEAMDAAESDAKDMPVIASVGVGVAYLSLARDGAQPAAELLGAADAVRGIEAVGDPDVQRLATRLRGELGDGFAAARTRGSTLGRKDAIARLRAALP